MTTMMACAAVAVVERHWPIASEASCYRHRHHQHHPSDSYWFASYFPASAQSWPVAIAVVANAMLGRYAAAAAADMLVVVAAAAVVTKPVVVGVDCSGWRRALTTTLSIGVQVVAAVAFRN